MRALFLSLFLVAISLSPARPDDVRYVYSSEDSFLNLRTGPGTQYPVVREMLNYDKIRVVEDAGAWVRVVHESGARGWASSEYLVREDAAGADGQLYVFSPDDGFLNLRTGPGARYRILRRMNNGEFVTVLEQNGGWARVRHESGDVGWAARGYLREID